MLISVVIPTYNRAYIIDKAIKSVINQSAQNFEIIVVDDGSTDNTEKVITNFHNEGIRYIKHSENRGEAKASNTGIINSKGELIAFLDSDDEFFPEKLEKQIKLLDSSRSLGAVFTYVLVYTLKGEKDIWIPFDPPRSYCVSSGLFRKEVFDKIGLFDESLELSCDVEMGLRLIKHCSTKTIQEILMIKRKSPDAKSLSPNADYLRYKSRKRILERHRLFLKERFGRGYVAKEFCGQGKFLLQRGSINEARKWFWEAFILCPFQSRNLLKLIKTVLRFWVKLRSRKEKRR